MTNRKTYTGFQRNHLGPLKFKMADVCNIENRFGGITHSHLSALSEILRKEAVFTEFRQWDRYTRSTGRISCFPNAVGA